ncbi:MAG: nucleotidyltransferase domain-containing protein [Pseudomonadota bacterium]
MTAPHAIAPKIRTEIDHRLATLASEEGVRLLLAVESGSRAWGFPSPDSDYDVRFIYVRPRRDYLALKTPRDVIERPIVDEIDLNGWEIRKTLGLMLKHNAVVSEWMKSPIRYIEPDPAIGQLGDLADAHFNPRGYAKHYANLGKGSMDRWFTDGEDIPVKRYFYALRPALSIRALRLDSSCRPPMEMAGLIALKAKTKEAGNAVRIPELEALIADELTRAGDVPERLSEDVFAEEAQRLFIELVDK